MRPKLSEQRNTREQLIDLANHLIKEKGYSAFSYADLAAQIGITKASIHHHFPSKADLGAAVAAANCAVFGECLDKIIQENHDFKSRFRAYVNLFANTPELLPMCAALAADKSNLPENMQSYAQQNFDLQINWLAEIITTAQQNGELAQSVQPEKMAVLLLSVVEGASLTAKALNNIDVFAIDCEQILQILPFQAA